MSGNHKLSSEVVEKFNQMLSKDEAGHTFKKAIRNVAHELSAEEEDASKKYSKYADELENYGAPKQLVKAFRDMAKDEMLHHFVFNKLIYGIK